MEEASPSNMLVPMYKNTWRHIQEHRNLDGHLYYVHSRLRRNEQTKFYLIWTQGLFQKTVYKRRTYTEIAQSV
jgi:hypothetical protein